MSKSLEPDFPQLFSALGDPIRLEVIRRLTERGEQPASALSEGHGLSRQAIAKHLLVLEQAGIVCRRREGREALFSLESERLVSASEFLRGVSAGWDRALGRLRRLVEDSD